MDWVNETCAIACWNCEGREVHERTADDRWKCTNCGHVKDILNLAVNVQREADES